MKDILLKPWFKHASIVVVILIIWQIGALQLRQNATEIGTKILNPISKNHLIQKTGIEKMSGLTTDEKEKVINQFDRIQNLKEKHKTGFLEFYPYYFASSALLLILSSISVVIIFLVLQNGIQKANPYLKTVFFTLAALTSFYSISPVVFKVESNIANNLKKYIAYDNLQEEIYNYSITKAQLSTKNDSINFNEFHNYVSKSMIEINDIDTQFDLKSIPLPDYKIKQ